MKITARKIGTELNCQDDEDESDTLLGKILYCGQITFKKT